MPPSSSYRAPVPPRIAVRVAIALRTALLRAADKIVPPQLRILELAYGYQSTMLLRVAARLQLADTLRGGPMTAKELAHRLAVDADALHRTMRALVSLGVFALDDQGRFSNNRLSETMHKDEPASMHAWSLYAGSKSNIAAWSDFEETVRTGKNAFERVHGQDCWAYFADHANEGSVFAQSMVDLTDLQGAAIAESYPFQQFELICDVAGGRGALLGCILERHPKVKGWLVDEPHVLQQAGPLLERRGVAARVERKPGNMFSAVPRGAEAYLLKDIIHDWDDERTIQILTNCRSAMDPGQKLLLLEIVVEPNETQAPGPAVDVHMMAVCCEGRQRSSADLRRVLEASGFHMQRIFPTPVPASIVEAMAI